ncbi:AAA domain-containing protein, putative AbiEii toxin, Type IV TA system [Kosakonia sacchari]|nr:AAA domain-containing protein, putative AbiEii toxin, Type IV TA system [Kosakonia sacchari]
MENLKIENFLSIQKIDITLKKINIFIGPQAQGKSVIAKLIKYFKDYPTNVIRHVSDGKTKRDILKEEKIRFIKIFPQQYWSNDCFKITYSNKHYSIEISNNEKQKFSITISERLTKTIQKLRLVLKKDNDMPIEAPINSTIERRKKKDVDQELRKVLCQELFSTSDIKIESVMYIPAGRSFFANLQKNVFSFLSSSIEIDYFLTEFGAIYEQTKKIMSQRVLSEFLQKEVPSSVNKLVETLICGKYISEKGEDFIKDNSKKINLNNSSSGQQESLPMALMLSTWPYLASNYERSFIIEEPEAHLFPSAQSIVVSLIAAAYNKAENFCSYTITTHSPYILSALNNLIQAGNTLRSISKDNLHLKEELFKIVPESQIVNFDDVTAYMVNNGKLINIIDHELKILDANEIDRISSVFSDTFDKLIEMECCQ